MNDTPADLRAATDLKPRPRPLPRLSDLLDETEAFIRRFVVLPDDDAAAVVVLYVAATHALKAFDVIPYLYITAAEPGHGKTRTLRVLKMLVRAGRLEIGLTASTLFRRITKDDPPTLLIDELDSVFKSGRGNDDKEDLRAALNSGYQRGATVPRNVRAGKDFRLEDFHVFCPKILSGIDNNSLPHTIADRSFVVRMNKANAQLERFIPSRQHLIEETNALRHRWQLWGAHAVADLEEMQPAGYEYVAGIEALQDREYEIAEPLALIAELAGGKWSERGKAAIVNGLKQSQDKSLSTGARLLAAIREIFDDDSNSGAASLPTARILAALIERESEPWKTWGQRRKEPGLTAQDLADILRPYQIEPHKWRDGNETVRGYHREDFLKAWQTYCPTEPERAANFRKSTTTPPQPPHAPQPPHIGSNDAGASVADVPAVADVAASPVNEGKPSNGNGRGEISDELRERLFASRRRRPVRR